MGKNKILEKWSKLECSINDDAVYAYKDNEKQMSKYNKLLDSDLNDGNDEMIQNLPKIKTSQGVRDILAHRIRTQNEQKEQNKTPHDKANIKMITDLGLVYNEAKTSGLKINEDLLTRVGDLSQQKRKNNGGL